MLDKETSRLDYRNKPNLLRVATEIATFDNPRNVANQLLAFVKSSMKDSGNRD